MKKIIAIIAVVIVIAAGAFFLASNKDFSEGSGNKDTTSSEESSSAETSFIQYCVYAPKNAKVTLDGKAVEYNEDIDCYCEIIRKPGKYTLSISRDGCETVEKEVDISVNSHQFTTDLKYTAEFLKEAEEKAEELIKELIDKCWSLDYTLEEYNFLTEDERISCEAALADCVSALEENLSAEYSTEGLTLSTSLFKTVSEGAVCSRETDSNPLLFSFKADYSYAWQFKGDAYEDSGRAERHGTPYIMIEKIDGQWYIRGFSITLDNGSI